MTTKANGDPLEGTIVPPSNYPNPVDNSVAMHSLEWAYGVGNKVLDVTAPSAPVLSSGTVAATTVVLNWTASVDTGSGVVAYDVYKGGVLLATVSALTYTATGLTTATAYSFQVKARDYAGNTGNSNTLAVTTA